MKPLNKPKLEIVNAALESDDELYCAISLDGVIFSGRLIREN